MPGRHGGADSKGNSQTIGVFGGDGAPGAESNVINSIEFTYTRSTVAVLAGKTFHVPWTETLTNLDWSESGTTEQILSDNGTTQTVKAIIPAGASGQRFVRLEVW